MKKTYFIGFYGMDGSGKSTLSSYLANELKKQNYNTKYYWWLEAENSLFRKIIRKFNKKNQPKQKTDSQMTRNQRNMIFCYVYPRIILIDYLILGLFHFIPFFLKTGTILIFDRYYQDTIYSLTKEFGSFIKKSRIVTLYRKLLPEPDLIFFIEIPPELALQRKPEEICTIQNAQRIWNDQQNIFNLVLNSQKKGKIIRIDNSVEVENAEQEILKITLKYLS